MRLYLLALFLHVSGAMGDCISLGIWPFGLVGRAQKTRLSQEQNRDGPISETDLLDKAVVE